MAQHEELDVLGGGRTAQQQDQPEHLHEDQIEQPQRHVGIMSDRRSPLVSGPGPTSGTPQALADAEPKTLRYRLLHTAAWIVRGQRKRKIKIPETWPWADELAAAFHAAFALPPPT